jgi:hypothetical protein
VDDLLKEVGLKYAEYLLPSILFALVAPTILVIWAFYKVWVGEWLDEGTRNAVLVVLGVVGVFFIAQLPVAYSSAKSQCRTLWEDRLAVSAQV